MEPEPAPQAEIKAEQLPSQFAAQLGATTRDALGHPVRREILRMLNASGEPRSVSQIGAAALPHANLSVISYHARVLAVCGSVEPSGPRQVKGGARLYASKVAGDEQIAAVLQATRGVDRWAVDPQ